MEQYLIHHGIKGQKWGVRRYQNEDGTLTPAGRERLKSYKSFQEDQLKAKYDKRIERAGRKVEKLKEKGASEKRIGKAEQKRDRLTARQLVESNFIKNMTYEQMRGEQIAVGADIVSSLLITVGSAALSPMTGFSLIHLPDSSGVKERRRRALSGESRLGFFEHSEAK